MHPAQKAREDKEKNPQDYCRKCLWNVRRSGPCQNHPTGNVTVETMSTVQLAKVKERVPPLRTFDVEDEQGTPAVVVYNVETDSLWCHRHNEADGCADTARVRLSGVLTYTVRGDVKVYRTIKMPVKAEA
jgi:hypothetical protein